MDTCGECRYLDLNERKSWYSDDSYCTWYKTYYHPGSNSCSHFSSRNYVVTAICDVLNKDTSYDVINTYNGLRNNMEKDNNCDEYLNEYDDIGIKIAEKIEKDNDKELCFSMFNNVILPIYVLINNKRYLEATIKYQNFISKLEIYYGIKKDNKKGEYVKKI